jgi:hypothetical protein
VTAGNPFLASLPCAGPLPAVLVLLAVTPSCATYQDKTRDAFDAFQSGQLERAVDEFRDHEVTGSRFLSGAEAGTAALVAGRWDDAQGLLARAAREVREVEERALIGPESLGEVLGTWAINDTMRAYEGEGFERVYLHAMLGLTYLAQGKVDDVYVEARLANQLLESEEKLYETEYAAGGLGHLLSGIAYELIGEPGEAYIDYVRMAEKGVGLELAGPALVRLSKQLGRMDDHERWIERFGPAQEPPDGAATIVVLAGVGTGPFKVERSLHVPTGDGLVNIAAPSYEERWQPVSALRLHLPRSGAIASTVVVEDVSRVARENLEDRIFWTTARSVARGFLKRELTQRLDEEHGGWGRLAGEVFSLATERADLRCWTTLPASWQAARVLVPPGVHELGLEAVGGEFAPLGLFELLPGETMFVVARTLDQRLYAHVVGGLPVQEGPAPATAGDSIVPLP